jgi:branched-chain amino acid transport system ATP-binding protein
MTNGEDESTPEAKKEAAAEAETTGAEPAETASTSAEPVEAAAAPAGAADPETAPAAVPLLELRDLHTAYGRVEVLHGINLKVHEGEIVTLIGANGAGKSTVLNTISGIVRATAGEILFQGRDISNVPASSIAGLGLVQVPEGRMLFPDMSVLENLEMGAYLRMDKTAIQADLEKVFDLFPILAERLKQLAGSLSGGEQQMCAIARALMADPKILLMDEPSLGLSPILVEKIFEIIEDLNHRGRTIILVEQNARMALKVSQRAYVLEIGNIRLEGPSDELAQVDEVKKAYLGVR